mmetsp:Transcript_23702/g.50628  ORF Transcript_23702/g.50628 Transcript_23702/m.50628 type:complete len:250 (-) Transcript_23702:86-835(-)
MAIAQRPAMAIASIGLRYGRSRKLFANIALSGKLQPHSCSIVGCGTPSAAGFASAASNYDASPPADSSNKSTSSPSSSSSSTSSGSTAAEGSQSWNQAWNPRTEGRPPSIFDRLQAAHHSQYSAFPLEQGEVYVPKMHDKVPSQGLRQKSRGGVETDPQENEFPGKGHRRAWNDAKKEREQHMKGVDTTRLPLSKKEYSIRRFLDRAPDNLTNMHAREDAEDAFGSNKKHKVSGRRRSRPGAVTIPMGR